MDGSASAPDYALRFLARPDEGAERAVRALFDAFAARDPDAAAAVTDPDVTLYAQPTAELAQRREPYRGHEDLHRYFADVERVWRSFAVSPTDWRVAGTGVICFGTAEGVPREGEPTGPIPLFWVFQLRDERIYSVRVVRTAGEAQALARG
jgi:ketosteroid isomerase-like protein